MAQWVKCLPHGIGKLRLILIPIEGEKGEPTPQPSPGIQTALWHDKLLAHLIHGRAPTKDS